MKDALGHGSDPRGAHQDGVVQVGAVARMPLSAIKSVSDVLGWNGQGSAPAGTDATDPGFYQRNYARNMDAVDKYRRQLQAGKETKPIKVDGYGTVVDGEHRLLAYKAEGRLDAPVERVAGK